MKRALALALRVVLGALLALAGALKLGDPAAFASEIANFRLLPALAPYLAAVLPTTEIVLAAALVAAPARWRRGAELATVLMFVVFGVAVGSAYFRHIDITCGCFGGGGDPITALTLARNVSLVIAAAVLIAVDRPS